MDPHGRYEPPDEFRDRFDPDNYRLPGEEAPEVVDTNYGLGIIPRYQMFELSRDPGDYRARYDAEICSPTNR